METKSEIRKRMRSAVPSGDSAAIWRKIEALPAFLEASSVLLFWSIEGEPDTHAFISRACREKRVLLPRVTDGALEIVEYSPDRMVPGYRGIMEPDASSVCANPDEVDFAVIPGMAFDPSGRRLGRGKGCYDRFLPLLHCLKAGVCDDSHIVDEVPVEDHDIPVDLVITPNNLYICNRKLF